VRSLQRSARPLAICKGPTSRGGRRREGGEERREREGKEREREKEGRGREGRDGEGPAPQIFWPRTALATSMEWRKDRRPLRLVHST